MKFLFTFFALASVLLSSDAIMYKCAILEKILNDISIHKTKKVWCDNKNILNQLKIDSKLYVVDSIEEANILIIEDKNSLANSYYHDKYIFVLKYDLLTKIDESFGALFWKKGRPNIVLVKPRLNLYSIEISDELEPYLEEKIW